MKIINDLNVIRVGASVVVFIFGYLVHELMHVIPLAMADCDYSVEFAPGEEPTWYNLTFGRAFQFESNAPPKVAITSLMAPLLLALPGFYLWAVMLNSEVVYLSSALFVATWIIVFLPSMADWLEAYRILSSP